MIYQWKKKKKNVFVCLSVCLCVCVFVLPTEAWTFRYLLDTYLGSLGTFWMKIEMEMEMEMEMGVEMKLDLLQCEIGFVPM